MYQILALASLCSVARNQDVCLRHDAPQYFSHLRISRSHNGSDVAVGIAHVLLAPCSHLLADPLIQRASVDQTILKFSAGRVGGLYQNEQAFFLLLADLDKRFHAVRAKVRIHGCKILMESCIRLGTHLNMTQMAYRISLGSGTDIAALYVSDNHQSFFLAVRNGSLISCHSRNAELLIHRHLRLYRRDQIISRINDRLVELPDRLCRSLQCLTVLGKRFFLHMLRHIGQHRVQSYDDRCIGCFDLFNQFVNHVSLFSSFYLIILSHLLIIPAFQASEILL